MASVEALPAVSAYTEFLLATAATSELGVIYAAMTPCMRLYAWLGQSLNADTAGPYEQWVRSYADSELMLSHAFWNGCSTNRPTRRSCAAPIDGRCS